MLAARLVVLAIIVASTWGCAGERGLSAARQECIECALREHADPESLELASERFTNGCAEGDPRSCSVLGVMLEQGRGVPMDLPRAAELFGQACRGGNMPAC